MALTKAQLRENMERLRKTAERLAARAARKDAASLSEAECQAMRVGPSYDPDYMRHSMALEEMGDAASDLSDTIRRLFSKMEENGDYPDTKEFWYYVIQAYAGEYESAMRARRVLPDRGEDVEDRK